MKVKRPIYFKQSNKNRITIAKDEIRIENKDAPEDEGDNILISIARQLEKEYQDVKYTLRAKIHFDEDDFILMFGGTEKNKNKHVKKLINYL